MLQKTKNCIQWACCYICTHLHTADNVHCVTNRSCKNLCLKAIALVHFNYVANQLQTIGAVVVQTANERRNVSCACLSSQLCLSHAEYQGAVCTDSLGREILYSLDSIFDNRNFNNYLRMQSCQFLTFTDYAFVIG